MPRILQPRSPAPMSGINGIQQYVKLENRLVLLAWLNSLLGYGSNRELLEDTKTVAEGFGADGRSFLYHHLISRGSQVKIPPDDLASYDENIRRHLETMNRGRTERITLRYFQYLAALSAEIVLDYLFHHKAQLLADLNVFVRARNARRLRGEPQDESFTADDLTKLAFWMATGSGKTLLLHLNYYQFRHYNTEPLDNILLITPNEGLSEQHLAELAASGIPARRFEPNTGGLRTADRDVVQVIEITKLVEEKRGGGVSVPVESFEGRNLIFVDEGHKGSGGEAWRKYRDKLGATGFTFEYSATFGQALSAARSDPLTAEYGKCIVFDYSYRYFYGDGYGKDFRILNLKQETHEEHTETLLLDNLLSFYEQLRLYQEQAERLRPYNLEKPLWVFVGGTVNAVYSEHKEKRSDVLTVVRFLHHVLENRRGWAVKGVERLLEGKSGLATPDGQDLFAGRFPYLRDIGLTPRQLYEDILDRIFHAPAGGGLHLCDIRGGAGELGLKAAGAEDYFGLIYIGDTAAFKKLLEEDSPGIVLEEDVLRASLFEGINQPDSPLHILVGAKKFMEGWNSWRVSNMGLLNIGREEGSQIIQLFGRGVRLRGKDFSLKRSAVLDGTHPPHLRLLETLNIFAVRADYMAQFRDYLDREGVETEEAVELPLFVKTNEQFLRRGLVVPRPREGRDFAVEKTLELTVDREIPVRVDMTVRVQTLESAPYGLHTVTEVHAGCARSISSESLDAVDWEQVYLDLLAHKERQGMSNLIIRPDTVRTLFQDIRYTLVADEPVVKPRSFAERALLQAAVTNILRAYVDKFYRVQRERWEAKEALEYRTLDETDLNLSFNRGVARAKTEPAYVVKVRHSDKQLIEAIQKLLVESRRLYEQENAGLPRIYFDRHLYLPLLVEQADKMQSVPPALKPSEARFVRDLKTYWEAEKNKSLKGKEVFLLRNLSRGSGIGFFEQRGFYPDFILWVVDLHVQRIVFVEPHGMIHAKSYRHDEKAQLHERLPALAQEIGRRSRRTDIRLDSFVISATPYEELYKHYDDGTWNRAKFAEKHILFQERSTSYDYLQKLFEA
jgi:hypothetical protein